MSAMPKAYNHTKKIVNEQISNSKAKSTITKEQEELINKLSYTLDKIIQDNLLDLSKDNSTDDSSESNDESVNLDNESNLVKDFNTKKIPKITIKDYLKRIVRYCKPEQSTLILSLIYIDRICLHSGIKISYSNIYKILIISVIIGIKYSEDCFYSNKFYSKIAGIPLKEFNSLEYNFLKLINFETFVSSDFYISYYNELQSLII